MAFQDFAAEFPPRSISLDLVEEINHRVANEYAEAIAALSLASRTAGATARQACDIAAERLQAHAEAHRALLPPLGRDGCDAADYLARICKAFANASLADSGIRLILRTEELHLSSDRCWRLGLIVAELIRNAARHGLSRKEGLILVRMAERSGQVDCLVCDSGQTTGTPLPGRGQTLIRALAASLQGSIDWWLDRHGGVASLRFPKAPIRQVIAAGPSNMYEIHRP